MTSKKFAKSTHSAANLIVNIHECCQVCISPNMHLSADKFMKMLIICSYEDYRKNVIFEIVVYDKKYSKCIFKKTEIVFITALIDFAKKL